MAEPNVLPLRSPMSFKAGRREEILGAWDAELGKYSVNIRFGAGVTAIEGKKGAFTIKTADGKSMAAEAVVLAIGLQGNLRKLGAPGEDLPIVQYQLDDPKAYEDETIVVVGAGDAAIENAIALAEQNRVIMINRNEEFARCKDGNLALILAAIKDGKLECRYGTSTAGVEMIETGGCPARFDAKTPSGLEHIGCHRVIARLGAIPPRKLVESFGVKFPNADPAAVPQLSDTYESNVPGLYIVGALGGYPLIKQAMNQGYEVVEYILGNAGRARRRAAAQGQVPGLGPGEQRCRRRSPSSSATCRCSRASPRCSCASSCSTATSARRAPDEVIFQPQRLHQHVLLDHRGRMLRRDRRRQRHAPSRWVRLGTGSFFGELGLISGRRRAATVKAGKGCVLIETPRRSILKLIASVDSVRKAVDTVFLKRAVRAYISQDLPDEDLDQLVGGAQVKKFDGGEALFAEGDAADGLYLLRRGSVTISRKIGGHDIVLSYVAAGNYVGEMALLTDTPRTATVRAAVATEAIVLDGARVQGRARRATRRCASRSKRSCCRASAPTWRWRRRSESGTVTSYLMQQGIGEATDVLLIDESLCIRCNNCEKACADVHEGTSRLNREAGPTYAQIHVPTSCRHCEHPHCMKDCPPDAINRAPNGEVYIRDTCIGCGNCERNCPYGVIQMAPLDPNRQRPPLWQWLLWGVGDEPGVETKVYDKSMVKKAVKCDMCKDLPHGPACVSACPTGAALRVSPERFLDYTNPVEA